MVVAAVVVVVSIAVVPWSASKEEENHYIRIQILFLKKNGIYIPSDRKQIYICEYEYHDVFRVCDMTMESKKLKNKNFLSALFGGVLFIFSPHCIQRVLFVSSCS